MACKAEKTMVMMIMGNDDTELQKTAYDDPDTL